MSPPKHALEVTIHVGAETEERLIRQLEHLLFEWEHEPGGVRESLWGGAGTAGHVRVERRDVTPERYHEELAQWVEEERAKESEVTP